MGAPIENIADEAAFQDWYRNVAKKVGIDQNPDDPRHYYDFRAFYKDMKAGRAVSPDQPGGHFPSTYKTEGHPRSFLDDGQGRVFDTRKAQYLTGEPVPQRRLTAAEQSPDMPGFDPVKAQQVAALLAVMRRGLP